MSIPILQRQESVLDEMQRKTATLRRVCEYFGRQATFTFLNCASVISQTKLIEGILNALEVGYLLVVAIFRIFISKLETIHTLGLHSKFRTETFQCHARPTLTALNSVLKRLRKHFILILDEIDHLTSNTNTFLYAAFQWPQTITNKLIVIGKGLFNFGGTRFFTFSYTIYLFFDPHAGVANSIDLTERLLPKLRLGQPPETLVFAPYTKDDITQIIKSKIENESVCVLNFNIMIINLSKEGCMDGAAVELCSRKVAAMTGDLRTALHVMKQTTYVDIYRIITNILSTFIDAHEPSTPRGCREVLGVLNGVFSSPLARARLPLQPRLLLAVAVVLSSNKKVQDTGSLGSITMSCFATTSNISRQSDKALDVVSLTNAYHRACDVVKVPRLEGEDLDAALQILESQSFIARAPSGKLLLQVNAATAKLAIADNQLIAQVTGLNL
uniref:Origin recognition complex subunit 4 n=1 Tax=Haemonchus placei TaxID=6290 RepID=A0A0N4WB18_HAEPC